MIEIFKHAWAIFIVVTVLNALILKFRSKKYIDKNPNLSGGYTKYFYGIIFYGNIPWIIMAIGNLSGSTGNVFQYFDPGSFNPFVLSFHGSVIILWLISIYWIYFKKGAEFIEAHPGFIQLSSFKGSSAVTAKQVKIFYPLALLAGTIAMLMMWVVKFPAPNF